MKAYIETDMEYLERKHQQYYKHLNWNEFITNEKLELIYVAIQELQQQFYIPDDNLHLEDAYKFTEDLKEKYLKEQN